MPISIAQPQRRRILPRRSKKVDEVPLKTVETPIYPLIVPEIPPTDLVDPLRCEDTIQVKSEPLLSADYPVESMNHEEPASEMPQVMKEEPRTPQVIGEVQKKRRKPRSKGCLEECPGKDMAKIENIDSTTNKTKEEKYATRNKWGAAKRAYALEHRLYFCDQCGKTFSEKGNFNVHLRRHKGTKEFQCQECDRMEFTQHLLNLHVRIKHRGELPYVCKYCGKRFDNCLKRLNHERNHKESPVHRPHVCSTCQKAFKTSTALKDHIVVHTGEQPFQWVTVKQTLFGSLLNTFSLAASSAKRSSIEGTPWPPTTSRSTIVWKLRSSQKCQKWMLLSKRMGKSLVPWEDYFACSAIDMQNAPLETF